MPSLAVLLGPLIAAAAAKIGPAPDAPPPPTSAAPAQDEPAPPPVYPAWKGAIAAGAIWTDGHSVTSSANVAYNAERRDEMDRWTLDAYWNWSQQGTSTGGGDDENDSEVTQLNYGAGAKYDYFTSEKVYYYGNTSAKVDPIADLNVRFILGAGVGYQVRETEKFKWGVETGLSYVHENYVGDDDDAEFLAVRLGSNLFWQLAERTAFEQVAQAYPSLEGAEEFVAKIDNRVKTNLTEKWIAQLQYVLEFDDDTPGGVEETDHRVVFGLGWSFGA